MPPDNSDSIDAGSDINFPKEETLNGTSISRINDSTFQLGEIGAYQINFRVAVDNSAQLVLVLNNQELDYTITGKNGTSSQISGNFLITTTQENSTLSLKNPSNSTKPITLTPSLGGTSPISANITIIQIS